MGGKTGAEVCKSNLTQQVSGRAGNKMQVYSVVPVGRPVPYLLDQTAYTSVGWISNIQLTTSAQYVNFRKIPHGVFKYLQVRTFEVECLSGHLQLFFYCAVLSAVVVCLDAYENGKTGGREREELAIFLNNQQLKARARPCVWQLGQVIHVLQSPSYN